MTGMTQAPDRLQKCEHLVTAQDTIALLRDEVNQLEEELLERQTEIDSLSEQVTDLEDKIDQAAPATYVMTSDVDWQHPGSGRKESVRVVRKERGWAGHYCRAADCLYRRNTLLESWDGNTRVVVSSVGALRDHHKPERIGVDWYYETMAFYATFRAPYWEADTTRPIEICGQWKLTDLTRDSELYADAMHDNAVEEITQRMRAGMLDIVQSGQLDGVHPGA